MLFPTAVRIPYLLVTIKRGYYQQVTGLATPQFAGCFFVTIDDFFVMVKTTSSICVLFTHNLLFLF